MHNQSVFSDMSARCAGDVRIGTAGEGVPVGALNAALAAFGRAEEGGVIVDCGDGEAKFSFCEGAENCSALVMTAEAAANPPAFRGPAIIIVGEGAQTAALAEKYGCPAVQANLSSPSGEDAERILRALLMECPVTEIDVRIPSWVRSLPRDNSAVSELIQRVKGAAEKVNCMRQAEVFDGMLADSAHWQAEVQSELSLADGKVCLAVRIKEGAFFDMLSETAGEEISDETSLMTFVVSASEARKNYAKVKDALDCARATGYGIVRPAADELCLEKPAVVRQGQNVGVKLKASAPSYHIIKVDVGGEVNPIMGSAAQSENMVNEIMSGFESDPEGMWDTNLFGKSLKEMVQEGLSGKVVSMQDDTRAKMRKAITRIVNEGKGGVICILL